jgi:hypothetical protein
MAKNRLLKARESTCIQSRANHESTGDARRDSRARSGSRARASAAEAGSGAAKRGAAARGHGRGQRAITPVVATVTAEARRAEARSQLQEGRADAAALVVGHRGEV